MHGGLDGATILLPAPAGMVPEPSGKTAPSTSAPRARGDGPVGGMPGEVAVDCSPRPRGWSLIAVLRVRAEDLLPAPAGMVPPSAALVCGRSTAPRARGDGPDSTGAPDPQQPCSPRPRGWSLSSAKRRPGLRLLPAPAGMVPRCHSIWCCPVAAPRARGDGPRSDWTGRDTTSCSPRPRGWSPCPTARARRRALLPAPAGMVLCNLAGQGRLRAAPRARGDGPAGTTRHRATTDCSPRPRGWSQRSPAPDRCGALLPAPAGVVPRALRWSPGRTPAPRARGDGPVRAIHEAADEICSPRPRGWSPRRPGRAERVRLCRRRLNRDPLGALGF